MTRMMLFFHAVAREQLEVISLGSWVVGACRVSGQQRSAPHIFPAPGDQQIPPRDARRVPCAFTVLLLCKTTSPVHLSQPSSTCFLALSLGWVHPWASHSSPSRSQHHGHCRGPAQLGRSPLNVRPICNPGLLPKLRDLSQSAGLVTAATPQPSRAPSRCRKPVHCALGREREVGSISQLGSTSASQTALLLLLQLAELYVSLAWPWRNLPGMGRQWGDRGT